MAFHDEHAKVTQHLGPSSGQMVNHVLWKPYQRVIPEGHGLRPEDFVNNTRVIGDPKLATEWVAYEDEGVEHLVGRRVLEVVEITAVHEKSRLIRERIVVAQLHEFRLPAIQLQRRTGKSGSPHVEIRVTNAGNRL
jgi:hypothetical protein